MNIASSWRNSRNELLLRHLVCKALDRQPPTLKSNSGACVCNSCPQPLGPYTALYIKLVPSFAVLLARSKTRAATRLRYVLVAPPSLLVPVSCWRYSPSTTQYRSPLRFCSAHLPILLHDRSYTFPFSFSSHRLTVSSHLRFSCIPFRPFQSFSIRLLPTNP